MIVTDFRECMLKKRCYVTVQNIQILLILMNLKKQLMQAFNLNF